MRVTVTRSGGFAGMVRRAELDSDDHPVVAGLLAEAGLGGAPGPAPAGPPGDDRSGTPGPAEGGAGRFAARGDRPAEDRHGRPARPGAGTGPTSAPASGADRFVYDIRIGDRRVRVGEADLHGPLRRLVEHILAHDH